MKKSESQKDTKYITVRIGERRGVIRYLPRDLTEYSPKVRQKLIPREQLGELQDFLRKRGKRIAFTTGVFDMIHIGHVRYIELARRLGDVLVVGLNSDASVRRIKGPNRPILDEKHRAEMLSFLTAVDYITIFDEPTGARLIKTIRPDAYLCVEGSWNGDIKTKREVKAMFRCGGSVFYTRRQDPIMSTTKIIEMVASKEAPRILSGLRQSIREEGHNERKKKR